MISPKVAARLAGRFLDDNAPMVLTGVAVVGAASIGYLTYKATIKAVKRSDSAWADRDMLTPAGTKTPHFTKTEVFQLVWMDYIPPAAATVVTIGAVVGAQKINAQRMAGLAAAYAVSERAYSEYRDKVIEKFNPNKEQQVRDEIAQARVDNKPFESNSLMVLGSGTHRVYDKPADRYFMSNMETIKTAANEMNTQINARGHASLALFYGQLDLGLVPMAREIGFTAEYPCDIHYSHTLAKDGVPCIVIDYDPVLMREFSSYEHP